MSDGTAADICTWLANAPAGSVALTANRRLARVVRRQYDQRLASRGELAWRSAEIHHWKDWVGDELLGSTVQPTGSELSGAARHYLWESCARPVAGETPVAVGALAGLAMSAFERLAHWQVPDEEVAGSARSPDERAFAAMLARYRQRLRDGNWTDPAEAAAILVERIDGGTQRVPPAARLVGFDRRAPIIDTLSDALQRRGCEVTYLQPTRANPRRFVQAYADEPAEFRAAGRWARGIVERDPAARPAIVVSELERSSESVLRHLREGFEPGWQFAAVETAIECSYGQRLDSFPAIAVALRLLGWLAHGLRSSDVGLLIRSPFTGPDRPGARAGLERRLRRLPDQLWTPDGLESALAAASQGSDFKGWRRLLFTLTTASTEAQSPRAPSAWASWIDRLLDDAGWPGPDALSSGDFQLVNRWRELLHEFAGLDVVLHRTNFAQAVGRLHRLAGEALYQPQRPRGLLRVLGPLEAAGASFEYLWVARVDADRWPAAGRRHPLLARGLQQRYGMPDATPADTLAYARSVLGRLATSADEIRFSWSHGQGESLRFRSPLLEDLDVADRCDAVDPGWYARSLPVSKEHLQLPADPVPAAIDGESLHGGASTISMQRTEPIVAFARGRLAVRDLDAFRPGLTAALRGSLIHRALQALYADLPDRDSIASWSAEERRQRCDRAAHAAMRRYLAIASPVLERLLSLERTRIAELALAVIDSDAARDPFAVQAVESRLELRRRGLSAELRIDRVDRMPDGRLILIDYKTGTLPRLIKRDGETGDLQLAVYAAAQDGDIAALSYCSIRPNAVGHAATGSVLARKPMQDDEWQQLLARLRGEVLQALEAIAVGDVRVNPRVRDDYTWQLGVLSRVAEYRVDGR